MPLPIIVITALEAVAIFAAEKGFEALLQKFSNLSATNAAIKACDAAVKNKPNRVKFKQLSKAGRHYSVKVDADNKVYIDFIWSVFWAEFDVYIEHSEGERIEATPSEVRSIMMGALTSGSN